MPSLRIKEHAVPPAENIISYIVHLVNSYYSSKYQSTHGLFKSLSYEHLFKLFFLSDSIVIHASPSTILIHNYISFPCFSSL